MVVGWAGRSVECRVPSAECRGADVGAGADSTATPWKARRDRCPIGVNSPPRAWHRRRGRPASAWPSMGQVACRRRRSPSGWPMRGNSRPPGVRSMSSDRATLLRGGDLLHPTVHCGDSVVERHVDAGRRRRYRRSSAAPLVIVRIPSLGSLVQRQGCCAVPRRPRPCAPRSCRADQCEWSRSRQRRSART